MTRLAAPVVTLKAPATVPHGERAVVSGTLRRLGGSALASRAVTLEVSGYLQQWGSVATTMTKDQGAFTFDSPPDNRRRYYRVRFGGDDGDPAATSSTVCVKSTVPFRWAPRSESQVQQLGVSYAWWGYYSLASPVDIRMLAYRYERREDGSLGWVYRKAFSTRLTGASDWYRGSEPLVKYYSRLVLPSRGEWRLRAYHRADAYFGTSYSDYCYVTVR